MGSVLARHFIDQAIDNGVFDSTADARRWSLGVVGLLGLVGAVAAMVLLPDARTAPLTDPEAMRAFSRPDRLMAIVAAMVGSGLLSCAIWPSMVFDRRDVEVLIGLPLSAAGIVKAKLWALCAIVLVFSCGTQLPTAFVYGQSFSSSILASPYTTAVHLLVLVAAGVFVFLFIAATQAVALVLLGPGSFLRVSAAVQAILTALIVAAVTYAPDLYYSVSASLRLFAGPVPPWLAHGPLAWFFGAYDVLLGSREVADLQHAVNAVVALGACIIATLVIYPVMYHRLARLAIEHGKRHRRRRTASVVEGVSQRLTSDRTTHAASVFVLLSLMRSTRHRQMLAVALGLAAAYCVPSVLRWWPHLATPTIQPPAELLSVPIEAIFILVGGLLLATCLPTEPGSLWVWRATEPDRRSLRSAVRRVTFLVGVVPVVVIATPVYWFGWGPLVALWHAAACLAIGALLIVITTIRRRTEPCAWPLSTPGPVPLVIGLWYLGAYYMFTDWFPMREGRIFESPAMLSSVLAGLILAALITRRVGLGRSARVTAQHIEQAAA